MARRAGQEQYMPDERAEIEAIDTSVNAQETDAVVASPDRDANAASPTSSEADEVKSTASIVRDVVEKAAKAQDAAASSAEVETKVDGQATPEGDRDPDDYTDVPFHKHPRFQQVISNLRAAKADVERLKPSAERYEKVQTFLQTNGLSEVEGANALLIFGLAKTDPVSAWKEVRQWVQDLAIAAGELLPDDLQQRVAANEITRETAFELSRARAGQKSIENKVKFDETQRAKQDKEALNATLMGSASEWEADRKVKDPNFGGKMPLLTAKLAEIHAAEGKAKTKEDVLRQLNEAYKFASEHFRPPVTAQPTPKVKPAIRPVTTSGSTTSAAAAETRPTNTLDIIKNKVREHAARA
jgi:hypothetical protein